MRDIYVKIDGHGGPELRAERHANLQVEAWLIAASSASQAAWGHIVSFTVRHLKLHFLWVENLDFF